MTDSVVWAGKKMGGKKWIILLPMIPPFRPANLLNRTDVSGYFQRPPTAFSPTHPAVNCPFFSCGSSQSRSSLPREIRHLVLDNRLPVLILGA
jgi:hypothetical protein